MTSQSRFMHIAEIILTILYLSVFSNAFVPSSKTFPQSSPRPSSSCIASSNPSSSLNTASPSSPTLAIPGGGIYFYHLYGQLDYLRQSGYTDNPNLRLVGASAGSLCATLFSYGVSSEEATKCAIMLSDEADLWNNPLGLAFVWGSIIEEWLDELIPKDSDYVNPENLCLLLSPTSIDSLTGSAPRKKIKHFKNRDDLINVNMCSVHIPLFLDKKLTREYLNERFIDGSFQSKPSDYRFKSQHEKVVMLDYVDDERLKVRTGGFVELISKEYVWDMIEYGYTWARKRDGEGKFNSLKY
ncbi:hypothetical protein TrLO_g887 [Triparma laevis f. longispina]|uniref:Patatin n=1 Tax=Triparma laevis f. longispina TaxID=1714387 RepID=A0A9W6Z6L4_9STRA|nr:hypothetical protein TrLO_g887 [Triparma laevis f. longispina]